jgi:UDP-N-acetylmuramoylalanine--D-glutamate ligase
VLNLHPDHLEWYAAEADPMAAYAADKAKIYERVTHACVYNVAEPATEAMVAEADVTEGARAIGFRLDIPAPSMLGVVDDLLVDRAFVEQRRDSAMPVASVSDVHPPAPHNSRTRWPRRRWPGALASSRSRWPRDCVRCPRAIIAFRRSPTWAE